MEILPILRALKRNKVGAVLVAMQIALTLAVVANALSIIQYHMSNMGRPSGMDETNIFTLQNHWVGQPEHLRASIEDDMAALRGLPGVVDAEATDAYPLLGGGWGWGIRLKPDPHRGAVAPTTLYFEDAHGLDALGLKLVGGRWFSASEIGEWNMNDLKGSPSAVLTAALAKKLFPTGNPVGQVVYLFDNSPVHVVGLVDRAQTPWPAQGFGDGWAEFSTFLPFQFINNGLSYVVRTRPGQLTAAMRAAPDRLSRITRQRVIEHLMPFSETRTAAYQVQKSESWLLATVVGLLLAITVFGTVGLSMYWVGQRRRQIGLRRALGATRVDILRYFHTENFLIAGAGALLGIAGGLGASLWMATHLGTERMSPMYIGIGAVTVLVLSQLAVLGPALRASLIPTVAGDSWTVGTVAVMLGYYLQLAIRSLRRNIALTTLMVVVVGVGIGASMTVLTTLRAMGADPIPDKSSQLFAPQIDAWGPPTRSGGGKDASGQLPDQLTYRDAMALMRAHRAVRQTAMYAVSLDATAADGATFPVRGRAAYSDFFRMFEVPFRAGGPWSQNDDDARVNVVVLTAKLADRLFPHANAVGKSINLSDREYRIVGVLDRWNPVPLFYDLTNGGGGLNDTEDVFLPFSTAIDRKMEINGSYSCNAATAPGWEGHLTGECLWLQYWAELPTAAAARDYKAFLYDYSAHQRQLGRFHWAPRVELPDVPRWMALEISVPETLRVSSAVAFGFLAVCLINTAGLMLARFAGRTGELGVRRALGASRRDVFLQCVMETAIVGVPGALVGLGLTAVGLTTQRALHMIAGSAAAVNRATSLDRHMMVITIVLAVCAMVCSALYPAWRASRVQPAWQLKTQ